MPDKDERTREPVEPATPDVLANPETRREWSEEDIARLREALEAEDDAEAAAQVDVPESLPPEAEAAIDELEGEYEESVDTKRHELLRLRAGTLTGVLGRLQWVMDVGFKVPGTRTAAEFVDVETVEKVMAFAIELFPFVGTAYAVTGYRLDVREHPEAGDRSLDLEKISLGERLLYFFGELLVSGHMLRGVAKNIFKRGAKKFAKEFVKGTARRAVKKLGHRAKRKAEQTMRGSAKKTKE